MIVTCLTVKPPYSDLIALGEKTGEYRNWKTAYRGDLYIHAAAKEDAAAMQVFRVDHPLVTVRYSELICVVTLLDIVDTDEMPGYRYKWLLKLKQHIEPGMKRSGRLMLWTTQI